MKPHIANFINSLTVILIGFWTYFDGYPEGFILSIFGMILLFLTRGIINQNPMLGYTAMGITFFLCLSSGGFLFKTFGGGEINHLIRFGLVFSTGLVTLFTFINCHLDSKKSGSCCVQPVDGSSCCDMSLSKEVNAEKTGCC